ncbi:acyltransferase [Devosia geojensis]|uniref:Acyltransferase n=1 Tax=Devosia geojensis TaxID=443610 RepID=A0A0F5FNM1_9HYPH|nr:acyltransferase family protein [Devosia geojensis]KKB10494.1 acyltransferase [Devosia geojensis]
MSDKSQRLDWVDTAKGLSILLVVMMHSAYGVGEATGGTGVLHWIIAWATPFRMPEFFLISGLFLASVIGRDWPRFADRRVVHYLYFYALWAVIHIVFKVGLGAGDPATAASYLAWAVIQPYGVLWFIYMLAVFSAATKLVHDWRIPHWAVLAAGAVLQIAPIETGLYAVDQFAEYFVYFYAGYALAPLIFRLAGWAAENIGLACIGLAAWAAINTGLVFSPGFAVEPAGSVMGIAGLPGVRLVLALVGSVALCVIAVLLSRLPFMEWLRWLGARSIVVYLAFALPMAVTREILVRLGVIDDTSVLSILVMASAVISPLVLYWLIERTGWGRFLFERPAWAHIPGTPGSRSYPANAVKTPAE